MLLVVAVCVAGLVAVLLAVYREQPVGPGPSPVQGWDVLPSPADIARLEFPAAVFGYDPVSVESALDMLRCAYEELLVAAPPQVRERARHQLAVRAGVRVHQEDADLPSPPPAQVPAPDFLLDEDDREALRVEVALAVIEDRTGRAGAA